MVASAIEPDKGNGMMGVARIRPDLTRRIGLVLRSYRQGLGLRQRDVAGRVGLDKSAVSLVESGTTHDLLTLERISVLLGRSLGEMIRDAEDMEKPEVVKRYQRVRVDVEAESKRGD